MKITSYQIDEEEKELKILLKSENQEESYDLVKYANRCKLPVKVYGKVDKFNTWIWISLPIKSYDYRAEYFGNDPDVVKK